MKKKSKYYKEKDEFSITALQKICEIVQKVITLLYLLIRFCDCWLVFI